MIQCLADSDSLDPARYPLVEFPALAEHPRKIGARHCRWKPGKATALTSAITFEQMRDPAKEIRGPSQVA
jgi:hypothetical protein